MKWLSYFKYDVLFQFRHGFYYAYLFVVLIYIVFLRMLPRETSLFFAPLIIFSDPAVLGCFFIGGMVLLEKEQNIYQTLFVTPYTFSQFIVIRVISLGLLSTFSGILITLGGFGFVKNLFPLTIGLFFSSVFFTLLGFSLAIKAKSTNMYFLSTGLYLFVFMFPLVSIFDFFSLPVLYLIPSMGSLILLRAPFQGISTGEFAYSLFILLLATFFAGILCKNIFFKKIILAEGKD